jgi:nitrate reductase gamma subunit
MVRKEFIMYEFVTGPLAWIAFIVFFFGLIWRFIWYFRGLNWQADRVAYMENLGYGLKGAVRSIVSWLIPFKTHSWRFYPGFTILVFVFHIGLLVTPIFLLGHNILLQGRWGFSLPTLPEALADGLTVAMIVAGVFIMLRRIALPEVRILTKPYDLLVLVIAIAPFITGFLAYHQVGNYHFWLITHILCGELMLVAIPFTKLSHFLLFFLSRAQIGMDFGIKRGGMKSSGMPW